MIKHHIQQWTKWTIINIVSFWMPLYYAFLQQSTLAMVVVVAVAIAFLGSGALCAILGDPEDEKYAVVYIQDIVHYALLISAAAYLREYILSLMYLASTLLLYVPTFKRTVTDDSGK